MEKLTTEALQIRMYSLICSHDGIKAREIARETGADKTDVNRLLYNAPFIHELCYCDRDFRWHGLIRQGRPHTGLSDFCGYYASVERFLQQPEEEWFEELKRGCRAIGRNLNDRRGLFHSFLDARNVMLNLFRDLQLPAAAAGARPYIEWEEAGEATAISSVRSSQQAGVYYNLQGHRLENPSKGIYIKDGKKILIK